MLKIKRNDEFAKWWLHWMSQIQTSRFSWVHAPPSKKMNVDKEEHAAGANTEALVVGTDDLNRSNRFPRDAVRPLGCEDEPC
jgi:hypothetical protein